MCSPTLLLAAQVAGGVNQTVGAYYSARSQKDALGRQAAAYEAQARGALQTGEREQQRTMLATANLKSRQRAAMGSSGFDLGDGTSQQVLNSTDVMGQIDAETVRVNALSQAWGYRVQAADSRAAAKSISPLSATLSAGFTSATQVGQSWYGMKKAGLLDEPRKDYLGPPVLQPWAY